MDATTVPVLDTARTSSVSDSATAFQFCGKGLHYDWQAIVAAIEVADVDAELAQMGSVSTHS